MFCYVAVIHKLQAGICPHLVPRRKAGHKRKLIVGVDIKKRFLFQRSFFIIHFIKDTSKPMVDAVQNAVQKQIARILWENE